MSNVETVLVEPPSPPDIVALLQAHIRQMLRRLKEVTDGGV